MQTVTQNFWVVYDLGEEVQITTDTKIAAQLTVVTGKGDDSELNLNWPRSASDLSVPVEASIAGLTHHNLTNIVPDSTLGAENESPILKFTLRSNHTAVTVNQITIKNTESVGFTTDVDQTTNIVRVELFEDTDGNGSYTGTPDDTRVSNLILGEVNSFTGINNQSDKAVLPIYYEPGLIGNSVTENGLLVPTYDATKDYPQNNEKTFFTVYHVGKSLNVSKDASGNITSKANARLSNAVGSANISIVEVKDIFLSNVEEDTPVSSNPDAVITISETNVKLLSIESISPSEVVQGQLKVPVLKLVLNADTAFPSVNIQIKNDKETFLPDNTGVAKVWIYRDVDEDGVLDTTDVFLQAKSTIPEVDHGNMELNGVQLISGQQHLLVLYDIGQIAILSNSNINAQLNTIIGDTGDTLNFGGHTPSPLAPTPISMKAKKLAITNIQNIFFTNSDPSFPFEIRVTVQNNDSENVLINALSPKIYLTDISGLDISHEFTITAESNFPVTLNAGANNVFKIGRAHV